MVAGVGEAVPCGLGILIVTWAGSLAGISMVTWEGGGKRGVMGGLAEVGGAGGAGVHRNVSSKAAISCRPSCLHCTHMPLHIMRNTHQVAATHSMVNTAHHGDTKYCETKLPNCETKGTEYGVAARMTASSSATVQAQGGSCHRRHHPVAKY